MCETWPCFEKQMCCESVILLAVHSVLQVVNCSTLSGNHYRESQDRASNLKTVERLYENSLSGLTEGYG